MGKVKAITWDRQGDCFVCTSHSVTTAGYPAMRRDSNRYRTIARWILQRRFDRRGIKLTPDIVGRHTCDNRKCINPSHIIEGTVADNNNDKSRRGRNATGVNAWLGCEATRGCYSCSPEHDCRCPKAISVDKPCECGRDTLNKLENEILASLQQQLGGKS